MPRGPLTAEACRVIGKTRSPTLISSMRENLTGLSFLPGYSLGYTSPTVIYRCWLGRGDRVSSWLFTLAPYSLSHDL
ncbi:hypothetical protein ACQ4M4_16785 [Leptolyngbya sp. AN02str]